MRRRLLNYLTAMTLLLLLVAAMIGCVPTKSFHPGGAFEHWLTDFPAALKAFHDAEGRWPASGVELDSFCAANGPAIDRDFLRRVRFAPKPDGTLVTIWRSGDEYFGSRWRWVDGTPVSEAVGRLPQRWKAAAEPTRQN